MNDSLKSVLTGTYGLTEEQVTRLSDVVGVTTEEDMTFVREADLTALDVKPIVARRLIAAYAPAVVAPSAPVVTDTAGGTLPGLPAGTHITLRTGRPEDMTLTELVQSLATGERSLDYINALATKVGRKNKMFVRHPESEVIDIEATLELMEFVLGGGDSPEFWGDQPTETLDEALQKIYWANPLSGERLGKGAAWLKIPADRRVLAAFARITNLLTGHEDQQVLIDELRSADFNDRWTKVNAAFHRAERNNDPSVLQAQASLRWSAKGSRRPADDTFRRGRIADNIDERQ